MGGTMESILLPVKTTEWNKKKQRNGKLNDATVLKSNGSMHANPQTKI